MFDALFMAGLIVWDRDGALVPAKRRRRRRKAKK